MGEVCKNCYWYKPNSSNSAKINRLKDLGKVNETDTCEDFILEEDYEPTGIWAGVAKDSYFQWVSKDFMRQKGLKCQNDARIAGISGKLRRG